MVMKRVLSGGAIAPFLLSIAVAVALLVSTLGVQPAKADNLYASIRGRVLDQTGAVVPDVQIRAISVGTGISYPAESGKDGSYVFQQLPIGDYKVTGEKQGFRTFVASNIHLELNQVFQLDIPLEVGTVSQEVMVEANQAQVETSSPQLGSVIDSNQIVNMPLIGRNWINLQQLQPGVVAASDGRGGFATNGSESQQNSYLIDGTDTNDLPLNTPLIIPSPDAIAEFRMVTSTINPEYGRNSGAILNAVTKSGSNHFHGDAFDFYRDTFLNARNFFAKSAANGGTGQVFHQHQFGGVVGGPVIKNHTFFFFSYQGIRARQPQVTVQNTTVYDSSVLDPTNLAAGANFGTSILSSNIAPITLTGSDGKSYAAGTTAYSTIFGCVGAPSGCVQGFVPASDFNTISQKLIAKFVPKPNLGTNQFTWNPLVLVDTNQYIARIDQTFNSKDSLWGTWFIQHAPRVSDLPFTGSNLPGNSETDDVHDKEVTVAWTHVFNNHMLNEVRGGYTRLNFNAVNPTTPALPSSFGFGITPQLASGAGLPVVTVKGLFILGFSNNGPQPRIDQTYEAVDNFSISSGRHNLKFGFDMRRFQVFNPFSNQNSGNYNFNASGSLTTSNAGADFLLGIPTNYGQASGGVVDARAQEYYSYVQDEWKARPNLTITYGIGWTVDTPIFDRANNGNAQFAFRPGQQSIVFPNAPIGYVFNGDPGVHAAGTTKMFKDFGPRLGIAWSPEGGNWLTGGAGKTSIRAGYGIYYNRSEEEQILQFLGAPPFTFSTTGAANPSFGNPFQDIKTGATTTNPFPYPGPTKNINFAQFLPLYQFVSGVDPNTTSPMAMNYNLTIQRQISGSTLVSAGYVGAVAHHLTVATPANLPVNSQPCVADPNCNAFNVNALHPEDFLYNSTIYGTLDQIATRGDSTYNALQLSVNRHLSHGLQVTGSYTYSHSIDDTSGFENSAFGGGGFGGFASLRASNPLNLALDKGSSIFDAKHRFVLSYFYSIPSVRHLKSMGWMPSRVSDGWTIAGITTFQTGFPLDVVDGNLSSDQCMAAIQDFACPDAPNVNGSVSYFNPRNSKTPVTSNACAAAGTPSANLTGHYWFSPSAFTCEALGSLGNSGRNILRGPGINNWDFQLFKDTRITESTKLELRIEFYNVFNHTQFNPGGIVTDISDPRFGRELSANAPRLIQLAAKFYF